MRHKLTAALLAFGPVGILLVSLLDSLVIPLPAGVDVLVLTIAANEPRRAYFAAFMAVLGSTAGNIALFVAVRHGARWLAKDSTPSLRRQKFQQWFHRYGLLTVFIPCVTPMIPFPLKVFVVSAAVLHTPLFKFLLVVLVARCLRYFGEAWLGLHLGPHADAFLQRNAWLLLALALAMTAVFYMAIRWREGRRQRQS
ncbi:MAG TPA: VTT domain-containing protein [Bryobacteraceae bacterium]|nr:VTT domain-containing protein [Bryobacteraceae bacterium]